MNDWSAAHASVTGQLPEPLRTEVRSLLDTSMPLVMAELGLVAAKHGFELVDGEFYFTWRSQSPRPNAD